VRREVLLSLSLIALLGAAKKDAPDLDRAIADKYDRVELAHLPTPLEEMKALSAELGGPRLYVKRDDQTGLAFGGNKARKLEYIFADLLEKKADSIITWAGVQSNWCRQTAAAARIYGIKPTLILFKRDDSPVVYDGNLLLDLIMDADVRIIEPGRERQAMVDRIVEEEKAKGFHPYVVPVGGSSIGGSMTEPLGAISYAAAFSEIHRQAIAKGYPFSYVVLPTGSGGTQAGLVVGAKAIDPSVQIIGISVSSDKASVKATVAKIANETAKVLGVDLDFTVDEIVVFDDYVGEGYGKLNRSHADAIALTARKEGVLLDPVYTGKAMAGTIDLIKKGYFKKDEGVVFLHSGGTPALFVYKDRLLELIEK
jgi:D-cysteine desulfhydrase family pyridoxal phosphate-dependent enzyme